MKSKRSWAVAALFAGMIAVVGPLFLLAVPGCVDDRSPIPPPPAPTKIVAPVTKSEAPIAGHFRSYGWTRPTKAASPSTRFRLKVPVVNGANPIKVDLRSKDVPIYDQGQLGSCTGNGWAAAVEFLDKNRVTAPSKKLSDLDKILIWLDLQKKPAPAPTVYFPPSREFIYWCERALEGTTGQDAGAAVADGGKVVSTTGTPPESVWPYDLNRFTVKPSKAAYAAAAKHVSPEPSSVDTSDLDEVRTALAKGQPIVFGFDVYQSFESVGSDGVYNPAGKYVGGHCVVALGYDDVAKRVIVRNSWGTQWGSGGYFYFPYASFASRQTSDAWTLPAAN